MLALLINSQEEEGQKDHQLIEVTVVRLDQALTVQATGLVKVIHLHDLHLQADHHLDLAQDQLLEAEVIRVLQDHLLDLDQHLATDHDTADDHHLVEDAAVIQEAEVADADILVPISISQNSSIKR